jgi:dTDP-4-dehydrorhamnose 3,5-epimerase
MTTAASVHESDVIAGVYIIEPQQFGDERGVFVESYRREWIPGSDEMIQGNRADRSQGCIVGLHFHRHQADYWYVTSGWVRVVLHDLRAGSPTEGATLTLEVGSRPGRPTDHRAVYIPPGVAHGFAALTDATVTYLVDRYYDPADELGIAWDDPEVAAEWGLDDPILSNRDRSNPKRAELTDPPRYEAPAGR